MDIYVCSIIFVLLKPSDKSGSVSFGLFALHF